MRPTTDTYPVFEANQVLTNAHLNQVVSYLDEQERLTRANLIGIGIVCGLTIRLEATAAATTIYLAKGCGITSEGYLLSEPDDVALVAYRPAYQVPPELAYPPLTDAAAKAQYPLWELFPAGEPGTTALGSPAGFLDDKAMLLFLELKKEGLRNCSPNNCDDKGASVTATVRRLLIRVPDLAKIMAVANRLDPQLTSTDLESTLSARLHLPDLRLPRYDVPNTQPATSGQVLGAFLEVFHRGKLASALGAALSAAYQAFRPVVQAAYPADPFAGFGAQFGFLDATPATTAQVRFLQYYYDLFDDLLGAYEELRWQGLDLLCACCPPTELFPRHLMLGVLNPAAVPTPGFYRQAFLSSAAISRCETQTQALVSLFRRLAEMVAQFTHTPPLTPPAAPKSRTDAQIRLTPSQLGSGPLSEKAIPYYYLQTGTPPLHQVWSPRHTRRGRPTHNLSYRAAEYVPTPPPFVLQPLGYDLEPYNFLRIEGHLGKNYQSVLTTLVALKTRYRLPIEVIALRTGSFDETIPVDLSKENCRFQDLETLYATLRAELTALLCKEVQYFYGLPVDARRDSASADAPTKPKLPLLVACAPDFLVQPRTLGRLFEDILSKQLGGIVPDIDASAILNVLATLDLGQNVVIIAYLISYVAKLVEQLTPELTELNFTSFEKRYRDLTSVTEAIEREREQATGDLQGSANLLSWEALDDRLEDIRYHCQQAAFGALWAEYQRRLTEVRQKQFLSYFLQGNPGIQHKAGVPLGGTFILVYHDDPAPARPTLSGPNQLASGRGAATNAARTQAQLAARPIDQAAVAAALTRISADRQLLANEDLRFILGTFTGVVPDLIAGPPRQGEADAILARAVSELADGTVIADFFLPYICCSDCAPVQFVLPKTPPSFTVQVGCTNANDEAEATIVPSGGTAPYSLSIDQRGYQPLSGAPLLAAGPHTLVLRDAEAAESAPQTITVPARLVLSQPKFDCLDDRNEYVATLRIRGGTPPYAANRGTVTGTTYASDALPGDTEIELIITDSQHCTASQKFSYSCKSELTFRAVVGCTSPKQEASVQILPAGGTAPYQVQVDGAAPVPVGDSLSLAVGQHKIRVRDAAGTTSKAQEVTVAEQLTVVEADFACEGTSTYRSTVRIAGGTPPYVANGQPVLGNVFTTDPIASGTPGEVAVTDQQNCTAALTVQHTCAEPCPLPCAGQSRRAAYRLWLQPPTKGARYETYRPESAVKFRFNGKDLKMPDSSDFLQLTNEQLNENFQDAIGSIIKELNAALNQALVAELGPEGDNRLVLKYDPSPADPFGVLLLEYFVCETFSIEFNYTFAKPSPTFSLTVRYTNETAVTGAPFDGVILTNRRLNKETRVPAFDGHERNQCTGSEYRPLCEGPAPKLAFDAKQTDNNTFVLLGNVGNMSESEIIAWVWDALSAQATEPVYEGQKVEAQLLRPGANVRLTAITQKGCFGVVEQSLKL